MSLGFERVGAGPPLVLLHGLGHRRQAWRPVLDTLTPRREVVLVDLPGHGDSPPLRPDGRSPVDAMADAVVALLDDLELERPHAAGNSLGGILALMMGARGRAASVTALSPAGFWASRAQYRYAKSVFASMQGLGRVLRPVTLSLSRSTAGRAVMYAAVVARPSRMSPEQAAGDAAAFLAADDAMQAVLARQVWFADEIPAEVPVTVAWGTKDRLLPPSQAAVARQRLPQARLVPLPGCGHVPMTDDPALVARVLLEGSGAAGSG